MVGIVMGSKSDWPLMEKASETLKSLNIAHEVKVLSAHRTPQEVHDYASAAKGRGLKVMIAAAGGSAALAGTVAAYTILPVLGVPVPSPHIGGIDSLLSTVQMPKGIPVGSLAIGDAGAINAALLAAAIIGVENADVAARIEKFRAEQKDKVLSQSIEV